MTDQSTEAVETVPTYDVWASPVVNSSAMVFDPLPLNRGIPFDKAVKVWQHFRRHDPTYELIHIRDAAGNTVSDAVVTEWILTSVIDKWSNPNELRLRGGEMTSQEVRTVQAVLNAVKAELKREFNI